MLRCKGMFRQLFHKDSSTYTYIVGCDKTRKAVIIDPVQSDVARYLELFEQMDLQLVYAIDTHIHADHITGLGQLREATRCDTIMGFPSKVACVSRTVEDGQEIMVGTIRVVALATPGHTDCSFSFLATDRVFTGDTLLIRSTGRTDFQNGDAQAQYRSIHEKLFTLPPQTIVFPGHDYNGNTSSTIREEITYNNRIAGQSLEQYVQIMDELVLGDPKMMDVAVPANQQCGEKS